MFTRASMRRGTIFLSSIVTGLVLMPRTAGAQANHLDVSQIPGKVMQTLLARFPGAEIQRWSKETERGVVLYDIEFTQQRRKLENVLEGHTRPD